MDAEFEITRTHLAVAGIIRHGRALPEHVALVGPGGSLTYGEPLSPRFLWWNFVSSRKDRIRQAAADWSAGRMALPANDNHEFIPLPDRPI